VTPPKEIAYIVGIGRSGTSLLQSLLNQHPKVFAGPENYFVRFFHPNWKNKTKFNGQDIKLINQYNLAFNQLQLPIGFETKSFEDMYANNFYSFCTENYFQYNNSATNSKEISLIIDKNPINSTYIKEILSFNPSAKFIFMMRDYRANFLSRKESIFLSSTNIYYNALRWCFFTNRIIKEQIKNPKQFHIVKYEDLVRQPQETFNQILSFLSLDHCEIAKEMTQEQHAYKAAVSEIKQERIEKKYSDLAQGIFTHRLEQWKTNLTQNEIEIADYICNPIGKNFSYTSSSSITSTNKLNITIRTGFYSMIYAGERFKNKIFHVLPIKFKVKYFARYVNQIKAKR
jgi:hypothetical protein